MSTGTSTRAPRGPGSPGRGPRRAPGDRAGRPRTRRDAAGAAGPPDQVGRTGGRPGADRRRTRRWVVPLVALAAAALAALGTWVVLGSDLLAVHDVRVEGTSSIPADRVRTAADVPVGTPLARVDVDAVVARVATLPEVAGVEVRRGWPRSLVVVVREREPVAVVASPAAGSAATDAGAGPEAGAAPGEVPAAGAGPETPAAGDGGWLVDATGVAYRRVDRVPAGLPWLRADEGPARQAAAAVVAGLPDKIARRVIAAAATTRDDVTLTLRSGAEVRWGSAEQPELKAEVLRALLRQDATWYDVSAPELPTTRG